MSFDIAALEKTVLFVDGNPVGYTIRKEGENYLFIPVQLPKENFVAPLLTVSFRQDHSCTISGTADQNLMDQVREDLGCFA